MNTTETHHRPDSNVTVVDIKGPGEAWATLYHHREFGSTSIRASVPVDDGEMAYALTSTLDGVAPAALVQGF